MKTHNDTVEFTPTEQGVKDAFDAIMEEGLWSTEVAAGYALHAMSRPTAPFVEYLSEGALTVEGTKVIKVIHKKAPAKKAATSTKKKAPAKKPESTSKGDDPKVTVEVVVHTDDDPKADADKQ